MMYNSKEIQDQYNSFTVHGRDAYEGYIAGFQARCVIPHEN